MADKKISALTAATTPLAGTEVLPIVQSATTVKASIANIQAAPVSAGVAYGVQHLDSSKTPTTTTSFTYNTANISSNVPTLTIYGGTTAKTGSYRLLSSDGSVDFAMYSTATAPTFMVFTNQPLAFGTNSANTFRLETTGDASVLTGNLVISTSGKGIDFSATPGTGTSELLADYEEGTWTPTDVSGAGLTFTSASGRYTKIGNVVCLFGFVQYPATASGANASIGGLPFTCNAAISSQQGAVTYSQVATVRSIGVNASSTNTTVYTLAGGVVTNVTLSATVLYFNSTYFV